MLTGARVAAVVPVSDLDGAIEFWQKLGLGTPERDQIPDNPGARFSLGGGGELYVYKSVGAGQSRHTIVAFEVNDIEQTVEDLRGKGVTFEEYDMPGMKTENGIVQMGEDKGAFFKDPDGNIIGLAQPARVRATV